MTEQKTELSFLFNNQPETVNRSKFSRVSFEQPFVTLSEFHDIQSIDSIGI